MPKNREGGDWPVALKATGPEEAQYSWSMGRGVSLCHR